MKAALQSTLIVALTLIASASAWSQIGIGIRAGVLSSGAVINAIDNDNEEEIDTDNITGLMIGIPVEIAVSNVLSLQPEINYLRRGYKFPEDLDNGFQENQSTYDVLEIPLLFKLGYTTENFTVAAVAGPAYQYILGGQVETQDLVTDLFTLRGGKVDIDFDDELFSDVNRSNFYGQAGVQFGIPIVFGKFLLDGRYRFALNDEDGADDLEVRNRGLSATAGIMVTLGNY